MDSCEDVFITPIQALYCKCQHLHSKYYLFHYNLCSHFFMYVCVYVLFPYMLVCTVVHAVQIKQVPYTYTHSRGTGLARYRGERERGEGHGQLITQLLL